MKENKKWWWFRSQQARKCGCEVEDGLIEEWQALMWFKWEMRSWGKSGWLRLSWEFSEIRKGKREEKGLRWGKTCERKINNFTLEKVWIRMRQDCISTSYRMKVLSFFGFLSSKLCRKWIRMIKIKGRELKESHCIGSGWCVIRGKRSNKVNCLD